MYKYLGQTKCCIAGSSTIALSLRQLHICRVSGPSQPEPARNLHGHSDMMQYKASVLWRIASDKEMSACIFNCICYLIKKRVPAYMKCLAWSLFSFSLTGIKQLTSQKFSDQSTSTSPFEQQDGSILSYTKIFFR
jgi:hypothetical protein